MKGTNLIRVILIALTLGFVSAASADDRIWGFETWDDNVDNGTLLPPADGQVDEWGRFQLDFIPSGTPAEPTATANLNDPANWGKAFYITGATSTQVTTTHRFLDVEIYDIQGAVKIAISGPSDANYLEITPFLAGSLGPTGDPTGQRLFNPGRYVFDMSSWDDGAGFANTVVQLVGEGNASLGEGFEVRRIFITDENLLAPVPEASSWLMLGIGMIGVAGYVRNRLRK